MKIKLRKTMTRKYFLKSIKLLNDSASYHTSDKWARRLGMEKKFFQVNTCPINFEKTLTTARPGKIFSPSQVLLAHLSLVWIGAESFNNFC